MVSEYYVCTYVSGEIKPWIEPKRKRKTERETHTHTDLELYLYILPFLRRVQTKDLCQQSTKPLGLK